MFNEVFGSQVKICSILHPSVSPSKIILFEKQYQAFDAVFHHQSSRAWNELQRQVCLPFYDFTPSVHDAASM